MRLAILLFLLFSANSVSAEFFRCDGIIQDRPCGTDARQSISLSSDEGSETLRKRQLISEFQQTVQDTKRALSIDFDGTYPQQLCLQKTTTIEQCQSELTRFEEKLRDKVALKKELIEEERKQDSEEQNENNRVIIIRDHNSRYWYRKRKHDDERLDEDHLSAHSTPLPKKGNPAVGKRKKNIVPVR
jgi:hypothetical protein